MDQVIGVTVFVYLLNIPFGFWRAGARRFSRRWYLAIHIPVPVIIVLRICFDLGWSWQSYGILVTAFFLGQITGKAMKAVWLKG
jgi:hypothetical protein